MRKHLCTANNVSITQHWPRAVRQGRRRPAGAGIGRGERVAVYLEKRVENVAAMFGAAAAGAVFVPVNPLLKPEQVGLHPGRLQRARAGHLGRPPEAAGARPCRDATTCTPCWWSTAPPRRCPTWAASRCWRWDAVMEGDAGGAPAPHRSIDADMAAILYTSGSTGKPKGVVLSHRNMVAGAESVASYLENTAADRILAVLPLSFDYGLSQLTTAFQRRRHRRADQPPAGARRAARGGGRTHHRPGRGAAAVDPARPARVAGRLHPALPDQFRRRDAAPDPGRAARRVAERPAVPDVRPDRSLPLDLPAAGRTGAPSRFDGQGDPERRSDGAARRRQRMRAGRTGRTGAPRRAGVAGLLERPRQDGRALQAGACRCTTACR